MRPNIAPSVARFSACLYRELDPTIMVMKSAEDGRRYDAAYVLDGAMDRSVFAKRPMSLAVPGKAVGQHGDPLHLTIPFAPQHGARPQARGASAQIHGAMPGFLRRPRAIKQPLTLTIQVTKAFGLQPIG